MSMHGYQMMVEQFTATCGHKVTLYDLRRNAFKGWAPTALRAIQAVQTNPCKACSSK